MIAIEQRRQAAIDAPRGTEFHRPDTTVVERSGWWQIVTPSAPRGTLNEVVMSAVDEREVEHVIDDVIATYRAAGQPTKWCVGPWTRPLDMGERLARRGFTSWDVRGMGIATASSPSSPRAGDVAVVEIGEADLDAYLSTTARGWSRDERAMALERTAHLAELARTARRAWFFGANLDGAMVGTAAILARSACGYLVGGVVLPEARGRKAYRALVGSRLTFLSERGVTYAVTQAREATSAPMLEHLGFETLFRSTCWRLE